jgi:hypothetical protein
LVIGQLTPQANDSEANDSEANDSEANDYL